MKSKWLKMVEKTGVLSSSRFRLTNAKVLSLLFTEYPFLLPSLARQHIFDRFQVFSVFIGGSNWKKNTINSQKGTLYISGVFFANICKVV